MVRLGQALGGALMVTFLSEVVMCRAEPGRREVEVAGGARSSETVNVEFGRPRLMSFEAFQDYLKGLEILDGRSKDRVDGMQTVWQKVRDRATHRTWVVVSIQNRKDGQVEIEDRPLSEFSHWWP